MLSTSRLQLQVPGRTLIDGLDFELKQGECCALLGRNGSGKSSLLLALAGLRAPEGGEVLLDEAPLPASRERAQQIGILLQDEEESFWGSAREYVALGRLPHGAPFRNLDEKASELVLQALAQLDLVSHAPQPYRSLSGGERQRARIAQLLVQDPRVFLLDEPLTHLDLGHQALVMERLAALAGAGRVVLMSLHEPSWAAKYCEKALLLYDAGRFLHGSAKEVLTVQKLEALYGCRLETSTAGNRMLFVPA